MIGNDYIEIMLKDLLNDVIYKVECCVGKLDPDRVKATKKSIEPLLIGLYMDSIKGSIELINLIQNSINHIDIDKLLKENIIKKYKELLTSDITVMYFYAHYNNNMELLNSLLDEGIRFNPSKLYDRDNLFVLSSDLSNLFSKENYVNMIKHNDGVLHTMFKKNNKVENINFAKVFEINPNFRIKCGYNNYYETIKDIISDKNIEVFGSEFIANSNINEQIMLIGTSKNNTHHLLHEIREMNPNFICSSEKVTETRFISAVGKEELAVASEQRQSDYIKAYNMDKVKELKEIYLINNEFVWHYESVLNNIVISLCGIEMIAWLTKEQQSIIEVAYRECKEYKEGQGYILNSKSFTRNISSMINGKQKLLSGKTKK